MPVWSIGSVENEPEVRLVRWRVLEASSSPDFPSPTRHFVGCLARDGTGRVCSAVQSIDLSAMRGVTKSGRVYELVGAPGWDAEGEYVWGVWCRINEVASFTDVTKELLEAAKGLGASSDDGAGPQCDDAAL